MLCLLLLIITVVHRWICKYSINEFINRLFPSAVGRFGVIFPVLAIAGSLIVKPCQAETSGTLSTNGIQFIGLLVGHVLSEQVH